TTRLAAAAVVAAGVAARHERERHDRHQGADPPTPAVGPSHAASSPPVGVDAPDAGSPHEAIMPESLRSRGGVRDALPW
ncbi:hypothetical protein N867_05440, partial [Actinotalea fermentans ATCC 43279 = JCM 9966 = DSM 3133]